VEAAEGQSAADALGHPVGQARLAAVVMLAAP
jgi:hypothetical protein